MKPYSLLAPVILFFFAVKHLRRAPNQGMTLAPRRASFYAADGQEWHLEIYPEQEANEAGIIWAAIAGMESYASSS